MLDLAYLKVVTGKLKSCTSIDKVFVPLNHTLLKENHNCWTTYGLLQGEIKCIGTEGGGRKT